MLDHVPARITRPVATVRARMEGAAADALDEGRASGPPVLVGHGLALMAWLPARAGVDPVGFWSALSMPDCWHLRFGGADDEARLRRVR